MMARLRTMTRQWLFPILGTLALVGTVMGDATHSPFDIVENQYQDGFKGATGYLPVFHPTPLTAAETTSARAAIYRTTPDPLISSVNVATRRPSRGRDLGMAPSPSLCRRRLATPTIRCAGYARSALQFVDQP